jgi:hypothetical protein
MKEIIIDTKRKTIEIVEPLDKRRLEELLKFGKDDIELKGDYKDILKEIIEENITEFFFLEKIEKIIKKANIDNVRVDIKLLKWHNDWKEAVMCFKQLKKFGWDTKENLEVIKKAIEETFRISDYFSNDYAENTKFLLQSELKDWWIKFLKDKINKYYELKYLWDKPMFDDLMLDWIKHPWMFSSFKGLLTIFKGILDARAEDYFKEEIDKIKETYERLKKITNFNIYDKLIKNLNEPSYQKEIITFFRIIGDVIYIKYLL